MPCSLCEEPTVSVDVPESLQSYAPAATIAVCTNCLTLETGEGDSSGGLDEISEELPDGDAGAATLLLADLINALAANRSEIEGVVAKLEDEGADPMLALDRLANDPGLDPAVNIPRRRQQLEQLVL